MQLHIYIYIYNYSYVVPTGCAAVLVGAVVPALAVVSGLSWIEVLAEASIVEACQWRYSTDLDTTFPLHFWQGQ